MKTILTTYALSLLPFLGLWIWFMCLKPSMFTKGRNRFEKNWNDVGWWLLIMAFSLAGVLTAIAVKVMIVGRVLDFLAK